MFETVSLQQMLSHLTSRWILRIRWIVHCACPILTKSVTDRQISVKLHSITFHESQYADPMQTYTDGQPIENVLYFSFESAKI